MTILDFNDRHRLAILATVVLEVLDENFSEAELENHAALGELYNLAAGVDDLVTYWLKPRADRSTSGGDNGARDYCNRLLTAELMRAPDESRLGRLRASILSTLHEV